MSYVTRRTRRLARSIEPLPTGHVRGLPETLKPSVVRLSFKTTPQMAAHVYGCSECSVYDWRKQGYAGDSPTR